MHDLAFGLIHVVLSAGSDSGSGGPSDSTVKVAIVTAIGLVVAAAITAFASTFQRERSPRATVPSTDNFTRDYITGLVNDQKELRKLRVRYSFLREACLERDLDPDDLIREQEHRS